MNLLSPKTLSLTACIALLTPAMADIHMPAPTQSTKAQETTRPIVDLAICLDTSGSMKGLLDATRRSIWAVINDLALAEPAPRLRIAFLTFGNDGHDESSGWVKIHAALTEDLDQISQELFAQSTNGGTELVARVVDRAVNALDWGADPNGLKIIIVAGNEGADQDTEISYQDACRRAIAKGIMVNAIYCGNITDTEAAKWRDVSMLADGSFATINQNKAVVEIPTPFDYELASLNEAINKTYLAYGFEGTAGLDRQVAEDSNALQLGSTAWSGRLACKAGVFYSNSGWDLVDACREQVVDIETIDESSLPEEMQAMTMDERKAYIEARQEARETLSKKVAAVVPQRQAFLAKEMARLAIDESQSLGLALRRAIRAQALTKGVHIPAPPVAPQAEAGPADDQASTTKAAEATP